MEELCTVCGNDPCICEDGFSVVSDDALDDELLDEPTDDPLVAAALHNDFDEVELEEDEEALLDDELDNEIDLPFTDED